MNQGRHVIQRTRYNSLVVGVISNKVKNTEKPVATKAKSRARKKRFGIFTKERGFKDEY